MKTTNTKTTMSKQTKSTTKQRATKQTAASQQKRRKNASRPTSKQWLGSKNARPRTVIIVAECSQSGAYRVKHATVRVPVNQFVQTSVPITDLSMFINDIKEKGLRH